MIKKLILCLFLLFIGALTSCHRKNYEECLRVVIDGNPSNLDPRIARDAYSIRIDALIYRSLFRLDEKLTLKPLLAQKMEVSKDGRVYTINIRKNTFFSSGKEVTSDDIIYTYNWMMNPENSSPLLSFLKVVDRIEKIDDYTFQFKLNKPYAPFPVMVLTAPIIPSDSAEPQNSKSIPPGSGPFVPESWVRGEKLILKRNPYYKSSKILPSCVVFYPVQNDITRVLRFVKGTVDWGMNVIPPDYIDYIKGKPNIKVYESPGLVFSYIGINLRHPVLKEKVVRKAIAYGINRKFIVKELLHNYAEITDTMLSPLLWAYSSNGKHYSYNPEYAKSLLDSAGYTLKGKKFRFYIEYKTSLNKLRKRIAEVIADQLSKIGIGVSVRSYEWGTLFSDIKRGSFDIYSMDWVGIVEPDILYYIFHSSSIPPSGANRGRYSNPRVDSLLELARYEIIKDTRKKYYAEIQKILSEELPYIDLWHWKNVLVVNKRVKGAKIHPSGDYMDFEGITLETHKK